MIARLQWEVKYTILRRNFHRLLILQTPPPDFSISFLLLTKRIRSQTKVETTSNDFSMFLLRSHGNDSLKFSSNQDFFVLEDTSIKFSAGDLKWSQVPGDHVTFRVQVNSRSLDLVKTDDRNILNSWFQFSFIPRVHWTNHTPDSILTKSRMPKTKSLRRKSTI